MICNLTFNNYAILPLLLPWLLQYVSSWHCSCDCSHSKLDSCLFSNFGSLSSLTPPLSTFESCALMLWLLLQVPLHLPLPHLLPVPRVLNPETFPFLFCFFLSYCLSQRSLNLTWSSELSLSHKCIPSHLANGIFYRDICLVDQCLHLKRASIACSRFSILLFTFL